MVFIVADSEDAASRALGELRVRIAKERGLRKSGYHFCWVVDFPLFEYSEEEKRLRIWPKRANTLSMRIRESSAFLRSKGVEVETAHSGGRKISIRRIDGKGIDQSPVVEDPLA